jgi:hypothetical protein
MQMGGPLYANARCRNDRAAFFPKKFQVGIGGNEQALLVVAKIRPIEFSIDGQRRA